MRESHPPQARAAATESLTMSQTFEFYDARAREAASEAAAATLDNVRDRNLRAEKTWRALASQAKKLMVARETSERQRVERRAAETDLPGL